MQDESINAVPDRASRDGLAAVAILILTVLFIVVVLIALV